MTFYKRFPTYEELYPNGVLLLNEYNLEALNNLVSVVIIKYFKGYSELEEYQSVGLLKAIELLKSNSFDPSKYSSKQALKNYLFTGIRNSISNYLYHYSNSDKEVVSDNIYEGEYCVDKVVIDRGLILKFIKSSGFNIDLETLCSYLSYLGLPIKSKKVFKDNEYKYQKYAILFIKYYFENT